METPLHKVLDCLGRVAIVSVLSLLFPPAAAAESLAEVPSLVPCPAHRVPLTSLGQNPPRVVRSGVMTLCYAVIEDPRVTSPRRLLRRTPVLLLTEDGVLIWNVQVFGLGSLPRQDSTDEPWLKEYFEVQLTPEELSEFLIFYRDLGVFQDIGKGYGVAAGMPYSRLYVQYGDSLATLWTGHTGWRAREFRGVNFRGEMPDGVTVEDMLAIEPPEQQRFMHVWNALFSKLTGYIPMDQSTWELAEDVEFIYESCTREQLDDAAARRAAFEQEPEQEPE